MNQFRTLMMTTTSNSGDDGSSPPSSPSPPIATPYFTADLEYDGGKAAKLLVTEWIPNVELWSMQMIRGVVDDRIAPKYATAIAKLNLTKVVDPTFNNEAKTCIQTLSSVIKMIYTGMIGNRENGDADTDVCLAKMKVIGVDSIVAMLDAKDKDYMTPSDGGVLIHGDSHAFNVMVEKSPPEASPSKFGPDGSFYICDWETSVIGPIGRDVGLFQAWPISCALCHAAQGNKDAAYGNLKCVESFLDAYVDVLKTEGNKDEMYLCKMLRNSLGWCGYYQWTGYYLLKILADALPLHGISEDESKVAQAKASLGLVGLEFFQFGFDSTKESNLTYHESRARHKEIIVSEIEKLLKV